MYAQVRTYSTSSQQVLSRNVLTPFKYLEILLLLFTSLGFSPAAS